MLPNPEVIEPAFNAPTVAILACPATGLRTEAIAVPLIVIASASNVPSMSASPEISNAVATTSLLNVALPAALPSIVKKVVSALPSVPLKIISVSLPYASIVISPAEVAILTAASPVVKSSYAVDMPS